MRGINKVILVGNLGNDPDVRSLPNGDQVTNISIATSKSWTKDGQKKEQTEWHRVVFFRKLAEIAGQYLKKGSKVYVEGELRTRSYDKDGQKHYSTEIVANEMQMLDSKGDNQQSQPSGSQPAAKDKWSPPAADDFNDDIPFS